MLSTFQIVIRFQTDSYRLSVTQKQATAETEQYEVAARNHKFLFECNRPALASTGRDYLPWEWKLLAGNEKQYGIIREIQAELQKTLRQIYSFKR